MLSNKKCEVYREARGSCQDHFKRKIHFDIVYTKIFFIPIPSIKCFKRHHFTFTRRMYRITENTLVKTAQ